MWLRFVVVSALLVGLCAAGGCPSPLPNSVVPPGYCAQVWASGLSTPRGIVTASNGDVLVVERGGQRITVLYPHPTTGVITKAQIANAPGLNHGITIHGGYLYASSSSTVYRWPYTAGTRTPLSGRQTIITGIPTPGHSTRTLAFTSTGLLLVQVGSDANVDPNANRAGIRQFNVASGTSQAFSSGAWFAWGLRNEVGVRADANGNIWGIENGMDNLNRADLGGDIHVLNPGEELNFFGQTGNGAFYGYPYCFSSYSLPAVTPNPPPGTQFAVTQFMPPSGTTTDAWCRNTTNNVPPSYVLYPHTAPLDLLFYYGTSFPGLSGDLFVAQHGSWNANPAVGYRVTRIDFSGGAPVSDSPFLSYVGPGQTGPNWIRPAGLALTNYSGVERLLVTSDTTGSIISITYSP